MNQPIPRSFFKDGQRARYKDMQGKIRVINGCIQFHSENWITQLMDAGHTMYLRNELELLDRTIDQVMEGDEITNYLTKGEVVSRVGNAVGLSRTDGTIEWVQVSKLQDDKYEIVQPNTEEVMTDETAKALREEASSKKHRKHQGERYYYYNFVEGTRFTKENKKDMIDALLYNTGNFFSYDSTGRKECEEWGKKYAPAFLHELKE